MTAFKEIYEQIEILNLKNLSCDELYIPTLWDVQTDSLCTDKCFKFNHSIKKVRFTDFLKKQFNYILENLNCNTSTKIGFFDDTCHRNIDIQFSDGNILSSIKKTYKNQNVHSIYNLFIRYGTAFDHYNDGQLKNTYNNFKESGTFLKTIAILPYIKSLGIDTLYLLPITAVGQYGKKGNAGSPYSIYDPYKLDENLSEPLLELPVELQFVALVEAAHFMGIKVICEFIFRTTSKDSMLALQHPEWFYWIKEEYEDTFSMPSFQQSELSLIKQKIENNDFNNLPEPTAEYQRQFSEIPQQVFYQNEKIIGITKKNERVVIPGSFADWPPDDIQPPWTDVTFLKLHSNSNYNYMAYNTIRMYDDNLKQPNITLWRYIENIIPFYQKKYNIDGTMIDMGHALPNNLLYRIIDKAKQYNPDFIFWQENFVPDIEHINIGFSAISGFLPLDSHNPNKMQQFVNNLECNKIPIAIFATSENHNTPRTASRNGNINLSKINYLINKILPIPSLILNGFELGETTPINTGIGFEEINNDIKNDNLPLFNFVAMNWLNENNIVEFIKTTNNILNSYIDKDYHINNKVTIKNINTNNSDAILCFALYVDDINVWLICIANFTNEKQTTIIINDDWCQQNNVADINNFDVLIASQNTNFYSNYREIICNLSAFGYGCIKIKTFK